MRFEVAAAAALVAGTSASYVPYNVSTPVYTPEYTPAYTPAYTPSVVYTTEVVSYTTFECPKPTTIPYGTTTYTVTKPTTLVVPCSETYTTTYPVSHPVYTPPVVYSTKAPVTSAAPHYPSGNATVPAYTPPAGTAPAKTTASAPPAFTGAASKAGVGLAAVFGLAAYIL